LGLFDQFLKKNRDSFEAELAKAPYVVKAKRHLSFSIKWEKRISNEFMKRADFLRLLRLFLQLFFYIKNYIPLLIISFYYYS
jgi:hypothetical protein